ncbi:cytosine permease [Gordonia jinhuaensis]|uniref:Cytosine permease n=1 Tax=Gordonia jinhuaensis TaxID=1517702 RepID=A0A916TIN6_9ACTN|nr:cytosine permease [Gordonia jinhuaensis]GGB46194.1 cytosine permease [Gordonia jinhuaensis]
MTGGTLSARLATRCRSTRLGHDLLTVETDDLGPIPPEQRRGRASGLFTLWFSANIQFSALTSGILGTAVFGLAFWQAAIAMIVGSVIGGAAVGAMSRLGPLYGVAQLVQSRAPFGVDGNRIIAALVFLKAAAWFAVETVLGIFILRALFGIGFTAAFAISVVAQVLPALAGHHAIITVQRILSWILTVVFVAVSIYALANCDLGAGFNGAVAGPAGLTGGFILTVAVQVARSVSFSAYASDHSRYLPANTAGSAIVISSGAGVMIASAWIGCLGALIGTQMTIGTPADLMKGFLPHTLGLITLVALWLSNTTTACLDCYSGSMAALIAGVRINRWTSVLLIGTIGGVAGWVAGRGDFWDDFQTFLFLLGYWVAPWLGVMVGYFYIRRGHHALSFDGRRVEVGLYAWLVGLIVCVPFMSQSLYTGPVAAAHPGLGDIAPAVGFLVSMIVCVVLMAIVNRPVSDLADPVPDDVRSLTTTTTTPRTRAHQ